MSGHTPTPWRLARHASTAIENERERGICSTGGYSNNQDPNVYDENNANAAFIVKAVNAHDALVEALTAMQRAYFDFHDANGLTQPVTGAAGNAMDLSIAALALAGDA